MAARAYCHMLSLLLLVSVILTNLPEASAFTRVDRLGPLSTVVYSGVVDTPGGFAYFGTFSLPHSIVLKVRLSDFTIANSLTLNSGFANGLGAVIDTTAGFAYFATYALGGPNYATIVKVRLSDLTESATLNLNTGENSTGAAVIDLTGGFAYFGTGYYQRPGIIIKVRLSDFTEVATMTLNSGEYDIESAVIDTVAGYAYFGTNTNPAHIVKVRLSDFSRQGTIQLTGGETSLHAAAIDPAGGFAYFGTYTTPGIIVRIRLSDFTRANALSLNTGENYTDTAMIDPAGGYAYFGPSMNAPGNVVKVRLSDFTRAGTLTLNLDEGHLQGAIIDSSGFAYFGTFQCCNGGPGGSFIVRVQIASASSAPQTLQAVGGSGNITLSWNAPSFNGDRTITGYKIYRGSSSGTESALATIGNVTSYRDSSANSSTTYYYKVTALNNFGESTVSNEASANAGSPLGNGNILGLPPVAFYGIIGALIAAVAAFIILFLRRKPVNKTSQT